MSLAGSLAAWSVPLPPAEKLVLLCLADHADSAGVCWPSVARLSERCGLHRSSVMRSLKALADAGHVTIDGGSGRLNRYKVHPKAPETGGSEQPVAAGDRLHPATGSGERPVAPDDGTGRTMRPNQSHHATRISQEPVINRSERACAREEARKAASTSGAANGKASGMQSVREALERAGCVFEARRP